jgi:hypothetical protein
MYAYTREIGGEFSGRCVSKRIKAARSLRRLSKRGLQYGCCIVRKGEVLTHFFAFTFYLQIATKKRADERTRTADLLITSLLAHVLVCTDASGNHAYLWGFRYFWQGCLSTAY